MKCISCGKELSSVEMYGGGNMCDYCRVTASLIEKRRKDMQENISTIPQEYRNLDSAKIIRSRLKYHEDIWHSNIFVAGTRSDIAKTKFSLVEHVWKNLHSARIVNYLAWMQEYASQGQEKWAMLRDLSLFRGYAVIDADNLCGISDQSLLYTIMQSRQDNGHATCLMISTNKESEVGRTVAQYITDYVKDPINKYTCFMLY
jgi:DNA-directed RNA polymerase subunit RPC12/RpoP